ncbi:MAG: GAF domain-containing protein [Anaerolineae bacterium]|jgi:GAF domain-containing protein
MNDKPIRVLLVDDNPDFRGGLTRWLRRRKYQVDAAPHGEAALRYVAQEPPYQVALIDFALEPGPNGIEVMRRIKRRDPEIAAVIFTGFGLDPSAGLEAMRAGAYRYLPKGARREEIDILIQSAADYYTTRRQLDHAVAEKETLQALYEAHQRKLAELAALNEVGRAIAAAVQTDDLPKLIYEQTSKVIDTTNFFVAFYHAESRQIDFVLRYERGRRVKTHRDSADHGLTGYLVRKRRPLRLRSVQESRAFRDEHGIELVQDEARSWLGVPILSGAHVLGAIAVQDYERENAYSEDQRELLQIIANYAAVALENARLFERVQGMARQLTMLHRITTCLQDPRIAAHLDCTLNLILTGVTAEYGLSFDRAAVLLLDETQDKLTGRMGIGHLDETAARQTWEGLAAEEANFDSYVNALLEGQLEQTPLDEVVRQLTVLLKDAPMLEQTLRHQRAIHVTASDTKRFPAAMTQVFDSANFVVAPLVSGGHPIGVIVADDRFSQGAITEDHLDLFDIFANEAAIAIENAKLNEETQRRILELNLVGQAARAITTSLELHKVLQRIVTLAAEVVHSDHTSVVLVQDGELVDSVEDFDDPFPYIPPLHERARQEGQTRQVIQSETPVLFGQVEAKDPTHNPSLRNAGIRSYAGLPLQVKEETLGVLFVHSFKPDAFQGSMELLTIFAHHAAIAIANARLFRNVQERARTREILVQVEQQITSAITEQPKAVLESIARGACEVTEADCAVIYPYLAPRRAYDAASVSAHGLRHSEDFAPSGKVREQGMAASIISDPAGLRIVVNVKQQDPELLHYSDFIRRESIQAFVGVRLDAGEGPMGVLFVNWRRPHRPSEDELDLITLLANYAAIAIQNARLYARTSDRLQKRVEELERIHEIDRKITATLELDQVFNLILEATQELTEGQRSELWLVDSDNGGLRLEVARGESLSEPGPTQLPVGQGVAGKAVRERRLWLVRDVRHGYWARFYPRARSRVRSVMAVPLLMGDKVQGAIAVESTERDAFDRDEQRLLERLAAQAVVAIQNATRYQEVERRRRHLEAIQDATRTTTSSPDRDLVLDQLVEHVCDILGMDTVSIALRDEETSDLIFVAASGPGAGLVRGQRLERGLGIAGWVAESGQSALVLDTSQDPRFYPGIDERTGFKSRSILCVPMSVKERVIGVIEAVNPPVTTPAQEQMDMLGALAGLAAMAIENARQYQELKNAEEETAAAEAVAWMGVFGSNWAHGINQRTYAIRNYLATLRTILSTEESPGKLLDLIEEATEEIQHIPVTSQQLPATLGAVQSPVEIDDALHKQVEKWSKRRDDVERVYDLHCAGVRAAIDQEWLKIALEKLINNALKAMRDGGRLEITSEQSGEHILIRLADTGPGIPDKALDYFLKKPIPQEIKEKLDSKGTGVGVLIARLIFRRYGGNLELAWSEPGKGTALDITLPRQG